MEDKTAKWLTIIKAMLSCSGFFVLTNRSNRIKHNHFHIYKLIEMMVINAACFMTLL